ncbi:MAG: prolyl oligopeptidase family serine peptidase, partial [Sphingobacteriales bacterium]
FLLAYPPRSQGTLPILYYRRQPDSQFEINFDIYYNKSPDTRYEIAFNPNELNEEYTYTIQSWAVSDSNNYVAVAVSPSGRDWREIRVRDLVKQKDLKDRIDWVKFSNIVWWQDGFFYARFARPSDANGQTGGLAAQALYYHKLGDSQSDDKLIMSTSADANRTINFYKTAKGRYLIIDKKQKINGIWFDLVGYKDLSQGLYTEWKVISQTPSKDKISFKVIDLVDSSFLLLTNYRAPRNRVVSCDLNSVNHFTEVIPEYDKVLQNVTHVHHELVAVYFTGGRYEAYVFSYNGKILDGLKYDEGIAMHGFQGSPDDSETIYYKNTFYLPPIAYRYNFNTRKSKLVEKTMVYHDLQQYTTQVVKYNSKDGTEIPMYLTYKKGLKLKGNNPVILEAYGGYGIPQTPTYNSSNLVFFDNNGILAVPMVRGGGEMGGEWYEAGRGRHKQNSFDDLTTAAQYLIREGYTTKEKLAVKGGLAAGVMMTEHPELFQVIVGRNGTFDMLRFNKFTGGKYWLDEYGSPQDSMDFNCLFGYSPLHNVKRNVGYPATLLIAASNDDRVPPLHTYKFLATIQELSAGDAPHVLYFEDDVGHQGDPDFWNRTYEDAFVLSFIFKEMHLPLKQF